MGDLQLYEELARYLDQGIIGSPKSPALIKILKILFPIEEAEIAARLPMQNKSLLTMYLTKYTNMSVGLLPFNIVLHIKRQYLYKQLSRKLL